LPSDYVVVLKDLKTRVRTAQLKAATQVNRELVALYLHIGARIGERQESGGWGDKIVERLAADLRAEFPEVSGFSRANVFYMRQVHRAWSSAEPSVQQLVGQIPWGHHLVLLAKLPDLATRTFYLRQTAIQGWSRAVLTLQIESKLHVRAGKAVTNFDRTLPPPDSDLAQQLLKDPYTFDFLTVGPKVRERELEQGFYLSAVDDLFRHPDDKPTIGLLLCKEKNRVIVEYALRDVAKPIGVAQWETRLMESLPEDLKGSLPTVEEFEAELAPKVA
jgi:predicted nuclease of restriction endonuclease-like (RecB) superfamily